MVLGHLVFNGSSRVLKAYIKGAAELGKPDGLLHTVPCHDVGVNDATLAAGEDAYGNHCKCPPGTNYAVYAPEACATRLSDGSIHENNADDPAYGCWFIPLGDSDQKSFAIHGRAGIGIHGGGSDLPDPFKLPDQGWEYTFGCLRLQNADLEQVIVPFIDWVMAQGGEVKLDVSWA